MSQTLVWVTSVWAKTRLWNGQTFTNAGFGHVGLGQNMLSVVWVTSVWAKTRLRNGQTFANAGVGHVGMLSVQSEF